MAYDPSFYIEFVRSSSSTSLVESTTGTFCWIRTSDGQSIEGQNQVFDSWGASRTFNSPSFVVTSVGGPTPSVWRFRRTGEIWLPFRGSVNLRQANLWGSETSWRWYTGYHKGFWAELVRSITSSGLVERTNGRYLWLRTSDGQPMDQERSNNSGVTWSPERDDEAEPDYTGIDLNSISSNVRFRAKKPGDNDWVPSNSGLNPSTISWNNASTYRFFEVPETTFGGIKLGSVLLDFDTVGGLRIGTDDVGGMKMGSDMIYEINEGPSTTPSAHHTYTIVAGGGNSIGYNGPGRTGSITDGTFTTPSNKAVSVTHTRNVGTELNFALTGTSLTATDFPTSIKVTKTTGGEVSLTLEPQSGSFRRLRSPANTWRQDYDPTSGNITSVFVSGQTIRVELFY